MEERALLTMMFPMETLFAYSVMDNKIKKRKPTKIPLDKQVLNKLTGEENIFTVSVLFSMLPLQGGVENH